MACLTFVECSDRVTDVIPQAQLFGRAAEVVLDRALDRSVIGGFSNIGYAVRSRLPHWPADPSPEALAGATAVVTGASSGLGEQTASDLAALGAEVHLDRAPLKYDGLSYTEIWISEAQERMVFAVPPEKLAALLAVFEAEDCEATAIGTFTATGKLELAYAGQSIGSLDMHFLQNTVLYHRHARFHRRDIDQNLFTHGWVSFRRFHNSDRSLKAWRWNTAFSAR